MRREKLQLYKIFSIVLLVLITFISTPIRSQEQEADPTNDPALKPRQLPFSNKTKLKKVEYRYYNQLANSLIAFENIPEKEIEEKLHQALKEKNIYPYIKDRPAFFTLFARAIKEKEPILGLATILDDGPRLVKYSAVMLSSIILGFILKRFFLKKEDGVIYKIFHFLVRFTIIFIMRIYITIYFYSAELRPMFLLVKSYFR